MGLRAWNLAHVLVVVLVGIVMGLVVWPITPGSPWQVFANRAGVEMPFFSGTLEARQIRIASEVSARVVSVHVDKGSAVKVGDRLIVLDDKEIQASISAAEAAVQVTRANLEQVQEAARPGQVALAEAALSQARADLNAAKVALEDAKKTLASPQDLLSQLHTWEARVTAAEGQVTFAEATLAGIKNELDIAKNDGSMQGKYHAEALEKQQEAAQARLQAAQADLDGAKQVVVLYRQLLDQPLELIAALNNASGQVQVAEAGLQVAQTELAIVRRAAQPEAIALAQAKLRAAEANLDRLRAQARRYTLASPIEGIVTGRDVYPGETAKPGVAMLTVADTRSLEITVFIPLRYLQAIQVGQPVQVRVPSLQGRMFTGHISFISPSAEFKPANIYNSQERSEIVFAVKIAVPNDEQTLKAGLPADVIVQ